MFLYSCKRYECENLQQETQQIMGTLYKQKIILPKNIEIIKINNTINTDKKGKFTIVHFFTADCDKCVNELITIKNTLNNTSELKNVNLIFIASAPTKTYLMEAMKKTNFYYPIVYEKEYYSFKRTNNLLISEDVYNTMLLNDKNEVLLFGSFYDNKKANSLYRKIIDCEL